MRTGGRAPRRTGLDASDAAEDNLAAMIKDVRTLADYPGQTVVLECTRCGRRGEYPKANLIARFGAEMPLPDVRVAIADCDRAGSMNDPCGVIFPDLR